MALAHSPSVVTNGLVMYYDMNNVQKSWKGKPTTNYFTNGHFAGGVGIPQENGSVITNTIISFPNNPGDSEYVLQQNGSNAEYQINLTTELSPSTTYCMSGWYAESYNYNGSSTMFHSRAFSASGAHVALDVGLYNVIETKVINGVTWKYCYATITTPADYNNSFNWYLGYGTINTTGYRYYTNIQMELGSYPSRFVNGTRSNTQAIIDLTNNNTLTATSLTYNSDNTFSFNGSNNYVTLTTANLPYGSVPRTIEAWGYRNTTTGNQWLLSYGTPAAGQSMFLGAIGSTYYFGGFTNDITASGAVANQWFHMAGVYDGTTGYLYINGVLAASSAKTWSTVQSTAQIGRQTNGAEYFNGNISSAKIYNRALTASEINQNFDALRGRYGL